MEKLLYLVPVCGLVALLFALFTARYIGKKDAGTAKMKEIADAIATGARAFLFAEHLQPPRTFNRVSASIRGLQLDPPVCRSRVSALLRLLFYRHLSDCISPTPNIADA